MHPCTHVLLSPDFPMMAEILLLSVSPIQDNTCIWRNEQMHFTLFLSAHHTVHTDFKSHTLYHSTPQGAKLQIQIQDTTEQVDTVTNFYIFIRSHKFRILAQLLDIMTEAYSAFLQFLQAAIPRERERERERERALHSKFKPTIHVIQICTAHLIFSNKQYP